LTSLREHSRTLAQASAGVSWAQAATSTLNGAVIEAEEKAREIAERFLDETLRPSTQEEVVTTVVREFPTCWIVGYNTRVFVETGSVSHALAGGGPIIINRATGVPRLGTSALPAEDQLDTS
jgi:Immunity protein 35